MLTYLTIGVAVQLAWIIFSIIRKLPSVLRLRGLAEWMGAIFGCMVNVIVWPLAIIGNLIGSYHTVILEKEES